jgi:hypothetical protein
MYRGIGNVEDYKVFDIDSVQNWFLDNGMIRNVD